MNTIYLLTLSLHNLLRWIVLILGIVAVVRAWIGWLGKREWSERDRKLGLFFGIVFDIQLLLGLLLYFVFDSPWTAAILSGDFSTAMKIAEMRFFSVEHALIMLVALMFVHLGSMMAKKAKEAAKKHRAAAIWFTLALLLMLAAIPWFRPLLRLG